ncbi:NAD+ kinase [Breznakia sp. PF5-3]|uniref:NAD kinase n=1 Tax=unclassified Breznakia TaxID=2623764 RepID=UPI002405A0DF|nr:MULTISPECIES: NAD kinase [unclassified Breznakia]MDL2276920.1 NAD kinase [Breznakia sp. OttesenSCG-928-G09]MDF9825317.1 NAD+ kinase [Breznakia sp. PM6-1]MDF9836200.1 NAD+ kinase [Breznakia sp. PF5-3]MDF9838429.1 NAD+ kinase [Breznakia sp. PFB2-8]MDF9860445.1 NAD+ kinase [Breznakia sp. PH5-24]
MIKEIHIKKFSIVSKHDQNSERMEAKVKTTLLENGLIYDKANPELVICIGGDGTLLYAVHHYLEQLESVYFVAIHTGNLGFFTDYREANVDACIQDILKGEVYEIFNSSLLEARVNNETLYALNEVRIENITRTQLVDIFVDGELFEKFKGNGICLSTQAGSTAYNRSLKGAVVDSGLSLMQLTEIAGIHDSNHRSLGVPYILKDDRDIKITSDDFEGAFLCYDHKQISLDHTKEINCMMSDKKVRFIRYRKYSYLERVKTLY